MSLKSTCKEAIMTSYMADQQRKIQNLTR